MKELVSRNLVSLDSFCFLWHSITKHDSRVESTQVFSGDDLIMNENLLKIQAL